MKRLYIILYCCLALAVAGCATHSGATGKTSSKTAAVSPVPARETSAITLVNPQYHFVVVDFDGHSAPAAGARLTVYRANKRVGAIRLTEPMRSGLSTADIVEGELRVGDEVR